MVWLSSWVYLSVSALMCPFTNAIVWTPENKVAVRGFFRWPSSRVSSWGRVEANVYLRENFLRDAWLRSLPSKFPDSWSKRPTESHSLRAAGRRWLLGYLVQPPAQIRTTVISRSGQPWLCRVKSQDLQGWSFDNLPGWLALVPHHIQGQHYSAGIQLKSQGRHCQLA